MINRLTILFLLIGLLRPAIAAHLPTVPVDPTFGDCQELLRAYNVLAQNAYKTIDQCMREPSQMTADGQKVGSHCAIYHAPRAWPQCLGAELQACQISEAREMEHKSCLQRASARSAREHNLAADSLNRKANIDVLNNAYKTAKTATEKFQSAAEFARNPDKFLLDTLKSHATEAAYRLFDPEGHLRRERFEDANALYSLASGVSQNALLARNSGLIRSIQQSALDQITLSFSRTMDQLDIALYDMDHLSRDVHEMPAMQMPQPVIRAAPGQGSPVADCSVLKNTSASSALMNRDEQAWLALVGKCQ